MKDIMFIELRECNKKIDKELKYEQRKECYQTIATTIDKVMEFAQIARKEGLLAMEEKMSKLTNSCEDKYLQSIILLIIDGTDPAIVEEIMLSRFFAFNLQGMEALQYLIVMNGCLALQSGENPNIIEEKLLAMIPERSVAIYKERKSIKEKEEKAVTNEFERFYSGDIAAVPGDLYYYQVKVTDYAIKSLDDKSVQMLLREVTNNDLSVALKGLSGETRSRVFTNMSSRLAAMIAEEMDFMGPVRVKDVVISINRIYETLIRLIESGEIITTDTQALCFFHDAPLC